MGTLNQGMTCLLLIAAAASSIVSLSAQAQGTNGNIVLERNVDPTPWGRNYGTSTIQTSVSANPSATVRAVTTDGELAGVASGSSIANMVNFNANHNGAQNINSMTGASNLPGVGGGSGVGAGAGASIANTVNGALSTGLAPLGALGGAMK
ncbi:hypothetical protein SAMN04487857_11210 [Pseudomonas sp. ok272]|uniref:hypothetical protein n=1 Tax=unclassified Pseudomonas TaxID=196821 RepID=UPI0008ADC213|nr:MULTISPECIES: hypothetical protein [unclassified Pseudomonas]SEN22876.1 hypothetical protein SAMN04487857_11210 [Pseudomonas sp. ok272]SFN14159.1 hypothetical protein SAMN04487858_11310 [Pseudomonas sp. ok602]